jgi:hypothetical protein
MVLAEGWYIHPLLDKVFQNKGNPINFPGYGNVGYQSGNGAVGDLTDTHKLLKPSAESAIPDVNNAFPRNWLRFGSAYNHADIQSGVENSTRKLRGLPFKVEHNITSGSYTLGSKAVLKGGIFPTDVDSRGKFPHNPSEANRTTQTLSRIFNDTSTLGPPAGSGTTIYNSNPYNFPWNLNGFLDSNFFDFGNSEGDISITNRISATVIDTDASQNFQKAFFDVVQKENDFDMPFSLAFAEKVRFGDGTIRMGTLSGSFSRGSVLKISGSGAISSSKYIQKADGQVTGSKINFTGGKISGSDMIIFANEFDFKSTAGRIVGNETTFEISSSLLDLKPKSLDIKGNLQAEKVYGQDTFLAGKVVSTGVKNPTITTVKYNLPFVEVYSQDGSDDRLGSDTDGFMVLGQTYNPDTTAVLSQTSSVIIGNHQSFALGGSFTNTPQFLVSTTNDGIGYPKEFKSWKDISGVNNDYVFVENSDAQTAAQASGSLPTQLIGNQLVFNQVTSSAIVFNGSNALTASNAFSTITTDNINLQDILSENSKGTHLQFGIRGTAHPSTGSFSGFNPEYKVEVITTSGSAESKVWEKSYKDTEATNANWAIFDIPLTDIVTTFTSESKYNQHQYLKDSVSGSNAQNIKVKISTRYSGSSVMSKRLQEGKRFGGLNLASGSFTLGFALTEMRMVEPVRIPALDTQTLHLKDTYLTWHDNPSTTGHYGNFVPEHTTNTTASFSLGTSEEKWDDIYLNLKQDNIVTASGVENKFVRINTHTGKLTFTSASAGGGGSSYSLPLAAAGTRGGVKIGYTENGKNYPVELSSEQMFVNVPWTDNNDNTFRTVTVDTTGNGSANNTLGASETLMLKKGSNVSLTEAAGVVTISATNTTYSVGNNGLVPAQGTEGHFLKHDGTFGLPSYTTNTDTNTTYLLKATQFDGGNTDPYIKLDANSGTDDLIQLRGGGATTVTRNDDGQITISSTATDSTKLPLAGGTMSGTLNLNNNTISNSGDIYGKSVNNAYSNLYRFGGIYFTWDSDSYGTNFNHSITSTDNGVYSDNITINSYGNIRMNFDSNNNGTNTFSIGHHSTGTGNTLFTLDESGNTTISSLTGTGNRMVIASSTGVLSTQAIPSGGGISFDGSTADGILTYKDSDEATVESGLTWASGYYLTSHQSSGGGRVRFGAGSYSSPTYAFAGDTDTGFYLPATGEIAGVVGSAERLRLKETGLKVVSGALGVNVNASTTDGRIDAGNDIVAYSTSDERLKENIKTIDSSLSKVLQIRGVEFDWKELTEEEKKTIHGNEGHDVGVIAQEIEKVLPEVVTERENGFKAVKYEKIVPLLIEAIKEQSDTIKKLTERIKNLEKGSNN